MIEANTTNDVFRYLQIRPPRPRAPGHGDGDGDPSGDAPGRETAGAATRTSPTTAGLPSAGRARPGVPGTAAGRRREDDARRAALRAAVDELVSLASTSPPPVTTSPPGRPPSVPVPDHVLARLSVRSAVVLADLGIDLAADDLLEIVARVESALASPPAPLPVAPVDETPDDDETRPYLRTAGVAELLVVKQHLKRYDRTDVAHVENVMASERRVRTHRALDRVEETFTTERETTRERETELETAERFEMQKETSRTIEQDRRFGFGLTVSGRYGPSVEFSSNLGVESTTSTQETTTSAMTYAKDVMSRSLERVVERVREEQVLRILREQEETNLHEFDNEGPGHVVGVYQFLEKVYESQVFTYGLREMLDIMVPEPASHLWWLESSPTQGLNLPTPPPRLSAYAATAAAVTPENYLTIAALYGVDGLSTPPPFFQIASAAVQQGGADADEEGQPRSVVEKEVPVPEGYLPWYAQIMPLALTDDELTLAVSVGGVSHVWRPTTAELVAVGSGHRLAAGTLGLGLAATEPHVASANLVVQLMAFETATFGATIQVFFLRTPAAFTRWQIATYGALSNAYEDAVKRYEVQVAELKAQAAQTARQGSAFGSAPSQNAVVVREELKRHCLSVITRERFDAPNGMVDADPPYFDFPTAAQHGSFARFFEQAIEWDQLQYVCYPYYWARKPTWDERLLREDVDPAFLEFFKAGAARVVVPVRPGFEVALSHYLEKDEIWDGEGEPPDITSDTYLPIVTEIQERTGADQGELPVGEPWETRVPTPLVILRTEPGLPRWVRTGTDGWAWGEEVPPDDGPPPDA
ncbi:hypothetical protein [Cellulomonas xiejunii]|uniref:Uncharacterized protein n=1 Tax=Cellulomonas xiejunii TaxID=2968083 RepID=A0ABY5KRD3_9CELL|nr:hypothetical protein [Cellulomonas xiejunii]MCC2321145.1 hypothetical protein [Cellulomonas xiejunii]UUI71736.1 hypothetical protein NP048_18420 [Cellulomonas xiejunii]